MLIVAKAGLHLQGAVVEAAAVLGIQVEVLPRAERRRERRVRLVVQHCVVWDPGEGAEVGVAAEVRHHEAAGPAHRRVGVPDIREVGDGHAQEIDHGVLVLDPLVLGVLHGGAGADLPKRRLGRILGAQVAC